MNLPISFQNQMKDILGEAYDAFVKEYDKPYFSALRVNTVKIEQDELCKLIGDNGGVLKSDLDAEGSVERVEWEPKGVYITLPQGENEKLSFRPGKSPLHEAGLYYLQEPSAMLPVSELEVDASGLKILDLCAAPGGKTTQIADYMKGNGLLIANEIVPQRAKILSENIERMGVKNAIVISADPKEICDRFAGFFDRILVDAPCSGEGMFRKHPEAIDEWSPENVQVCADRQEWILDCAYKMLKPGGKMVYSTCTFNAKEDEESVNSFIERFPVMKLKGETHRIFPHTHKGEGHFSALLIKDIPYVERDLKYPTEKEAKKDVVLPFFDFAKEALTDGGYKKLTREGIYLAFGDQIYLAPKDTPVLKNLKVLRPGLHLGTIKKGRFEPSHALALYLTKDDVKGSFDVSCSGAEAVKYLKGETLNCDEKGWILVTVDGYSLGWGKASNGILKNHYPKGLRWL